jgi:hypothetical protein
LAGCLVFHFKSAETANLDPLASLQGFGDCTKQGADYFFAILLIELRGVRDLVNELSFGHLPSIAQTASRDEWIPSALQSAFNAVSNGVESLSRHPARPVVRRAMACGVDRGRAAGSCERAIHFARPSQCR